MKKKLTKIKTKTKYISIVFVHSFNYFSTYLILFMSQYIFNDFFFFLNNNSTVVISYVNSLYRLISLQSTAYSSFGHRGEGGRGDKVKGDTVLPKNFSLVFNCSILFLFYLVYLQTRSKDSWLEFCHAMTRYDESETGIDEVACGVV